MCSAQSKQLDLEDLSDAGSSTVSKKIVKKPVIRNKHNGFERRIRICPECHEHITRGGQHFRRKHPELDYKNNIELQNKVKFKKGVPDLDLELEIDIKAIQVEASKVDIKKRMQQHNMYERCENCHLILEYKNYLMDTEGISATNSDYYSAHVSYILAKCCSKMKSDLKIEDIIIGIIFKKLI